jgi:hypothetical protein
MAGQFHTLKIGRNDFLYVLFGACIWVKGSLMHSITIDVERREAFYEIAVVPVTVGTVGAAFKENVRL